MIRDPWFHDLIEVPAEHSCAYETQPPPCREEWPEQPWSWCGACLAREIIAWSAGHGTEKDAA